METIEPPEMSFRKIFLRTLREGKPRVETDDETGLAISYIRVDGLTDEEYNFLFKQRHVMTGHKIFTNSKDTSLFAGNMVWEISYCHLAEYPHQSWIEFFG